MPEKLNSTVNVAAASLRCIDQRCGAVYRIDDLRTACPSCGKLLDVHYAWPDWNAKIQKQAWLERKMSRHSPDLSGVWRFREMIPFLAPDARVVTLREGNTPLLEAPRAAAYAG